MPMLEVNKSSEHLRNSFSDITNTLRKASALIPESPLTRDQGPCAGYKRHSNDEKLLPLGCFFREIPRRSTRDGNSEPRHRPYSINDGELSGRNMCWFGYGLR